MRHTIAFIFIFNLGLLVTAGTAGGSCPDSTTLFQSRVQLDQQQDEEEASSAAADQAMTVAMSDDKGLIPSKLLIISSPAQKKVVWTTVSDMPAGKVKTFALIEYGLNQPKGLAFDKQHGLLYIADSGAEKIFRYTLILDKSSTKPRLATTHVRVTIVQNCGPVEWVTLDDEGNLFYSSPRTNNINKVSKDVMEKLGTGEIQASDLRVISEKMLFAEQAAGMARNKTAQASALLDTALPTDPPPVLPHISSIYEAKLNPHVARPAAICVDGASLYWTNQEDGIKAGTVVQGQVNPKVEASKTGPAPFPSKVITKVSSGAVGIAKAKNVLFFTRNATVPGTNETDGSMVVSAFLPGSNIMVDFVKGLGGARSLLWNQVQTMFVADDVHGAVLSFPTGRVMSNAPTTLVASVHGAYGLAMTSSGDPWLKVS